MVEEANVVGLGIFDHVIDRSKFYLALPESSGRGPRPTSTRSHPVNGRRCLPQPTRSTPWSSSANGRRGEPDPAMAEGVSGSRQRSPTSPEEDRPRYSRRTSLAHEKYGSGLAMTPIRYSRDDVAPPRRYSGILTIFAAIRRASSLVMRLAAVRRATTSFLMSREWL